MDRKTDDDLKPDDDGAAAIPGEDALERIKATLGFDKNLQRDKEHDDEMQRPPDDRSPLT